MAKYWQRGESIDYLNGGSEKIEANTVVSLGTRIGVAGCEIKPSETGSVHVTGVFEIEKAAEEITLGALVYFSAADGNVTATEAGNIPAGWAVAPAASSDATALVKLLG